MNNNLVQIFNVKDLESIINNCSDEKETTITIAGNSQKMTLYTSDNSMVTKMKKLMSSSVKPEDIQCYEAGRIDGKVTGYFFKLDKRHLSLRSTINKEVSEEFKLAAKDRMKKLAAEGKLGRGRTKNI